MSTKPTARSTPATLDSIEYMRRILDAQEQVTQLQMQAQETSADASATVKTAEPLLESCADLRIRVEALQGDLRSVKIEKLATEVLFRDVGTLVRDTAALEKRIKLLNRELALKTQMMEISRQPVDMRDHRDAASTLRSRAALLTTLTRNSQAITASLISHMHAAQARLLQQAAALEKPASAQARASKLSAPSVRLSPSLTRPPVLQGPPSVSDEEASEVKKNPGKFLRSMVMTLKAKDFRKSTQEMQKLLDLTLCLPKSVQEEIFRNMKSGSTLRGSISAEEYNSSHFKDEFRVFVEAITTSSVYTTYLQELEKGAASERRPSPTVTEAPLPARIPIGPHLSMSSLSAASLAPLALSPSMCTPSRGSFVADMTDSAKWLQLMTILDGRCSRIESSHKRTLFVHAACLFYDISATDKLDIYARLGKLKGMDPSNPDYTYKIIFNGRLQLGDNLEVLRRILNAKYEEAERNEESEVRRARQIRPPKSESLSSTSPPSRVTDAWAALDMATQAMISGSRPDVARDRGAGLPTATSSPLLSSSPKVDPKKEAVLTGSPTQPVTAAT